jgi:ATP-dependent exoDNAse (exonuclease V) alpha subunit
VDDLVKIVDLNDEGDAKVQFEGDEIWVDPSLFEEFQKNDQKMTQLIEKKESLKVDQKESCPCFACQPSGNPETDQPNLLERTRSWYQNRYRNYLEDRISSLEKNQAKALEEIIETFEQAYQTSLENPYRE